MSMPLEIRLFEACGIPIYIHVFLIVYFVYDLSGKEAQLKPAQGQLPDYGKVGWIALGCFLGFFVLFLTVLIHELGHCLGAKMVGGKAHRILLWPLGGLAYCSSGDTPKADLVVALAGPLTHLPQYFLWLALLTIAQSGDLGSWKPLFVDVATTAVGLQIVLAAFNLLVPVYPLDCSRVIIAVCRICGMSARSASIVIVSLSCAVLLVLLASIFQLIQIPYLPSGVHGMNLVIAVWLGLQTYQLAQSIRQQQVEAHPLFRDQCEARNNSEDAEESAEKEQLLPRRRTLGKCTCGVERLENAPA
jgi:Zn-dependent protease